MHNTTVFMGATRFTWNGTVWVSNTFSSDIYVGTRSGQYGTYASKELDLDDLDDGVQFDHCIESDITDNSDG
jgi:hypothetical protein